MKKDKVSVIKKMWKNPRQKAILKLGLWFCFFLLCGITLSVMNLLSKPTIPENREEEENLNPPIEITFPELDVLWTDLEQKDYNYSYQIIELDSKEKVTYQGTKTQNREEGYRESKLGIIKYRIVEGITYQIVMEQEEEIKNLYSEEDKPYVTLSELKEKIKDKEPQENIIGAQRYLTFEFDEKIIITTNKNAIVSIEIMTASKDYKLSFTVQKEKEE